ncbi:MAG: YbaN family protein [Bacteroidia bacterium]|nr:YbaN family protein [Bacteroidia bacterium]
MSLTDRITAQPVSKEVAVAGTKAELGQNRVKRVLFGIGGGLAFVLAVLGVFVPGIPCTPFALLSAALFAKSSDKLYNWLLSNKILGPRIKNYQRRKGISKSGKIKVIVLMWIMVLISSFVIIKALTIQIIILSAGLLGTITVWFFVPEGKDYAEAEEAEEDI